MPWMYHGWVWLMLLSAVLMGCGRQDITHNGSVEQKCFRGRVVAGRQEWQFLHLAVHDMTNDTKELEDLLEQGFNPNLRDPCGYTPLHRIVEGVRELTPLQKRAVEVLIKKGADLNAGNDDMNSLSGGGYTVLHMSAEAGNKDMCLFLVRHKADINARTGKGETPLDIATRKGEKEIAKFLRESGGVEGKLEPISKSSGQNRN